MKTMLWLTLPALALAACHKDADNAQSMSASDTDVTSAQAASLPDADSANADSAAVTDAASYLDKAGAADLFEIESSRALLKTTQAGPIADFAHMMIKDHEASTAMLKKAAKTANITPSSPQLSPDQQHSLDTIRAAKGKDADQAYLEAQRSAHAAALLLHKGYAANGDSEPLKAAAAKIAPVVEHHIDMLNSIKS